MYFDRENASLEEAILSDNLEMLRTSIANAQSLNVKGIGGITPLMLAIVQGRPRIVEYLLISGASPNDVADNQETPVTLAIRAYFRLPLLLDLVLKYGGDPNTIRKDGDPAIVQFCHERNLQGIRLMTKYGANIDALSRNGNPIMVNSAIAENWDVVWTLIELGGSISNQRTVDGLQFAFKSPRAIHPDSPIWNYKALVWKHLTARGIAVTPPVGLQ
jgi:ankyrin repeat protein